MDNKSVVVKSNKLIESGYSLSAVQQKLILAVVAMVDPRGNDLCRYTMQISDFMELAGITGKSAYQRIRRTSKRLMEKVFELKRPGSVLQLSWFASVEYSEGEGTVEIEISQKLKPYLLDLKRYFTQYELSNIIKMKSFYSIRIYELLKQYENMTIRIFDLEHLRDLLGIDPDKYKLYGHFKSKVLLVAQEEIGEKTDLNFDFEEIKDVRKVVKIKFIIRKQDQQLLPFEAPPEVPREILDLIPEKYQVSEVNAIIEPYFKDKKKLASNIRYAVKNHKKNFIAYLKQTLRNDYARSSRDIKKNEEIAIGRKGEQAVAEIEKAEREKEIMQAVEDWKTRAPDSLLQDIQIRATQEIKQEHPEITKNFLGLPTRIRVDDIIAREYLEAEEVSRES